MGKFDNPKGPRDFYSGRMNEQDVFGEFKPTKEGLNAFRAEARENGYITRERAIELIRQYTKEDPTNPSKPFAKELRLAVIDQLGLEDDEDLDRIRFYSAVGTPLDVFHGVDGWIEFCSETGFPIMVTLDVTKDPERVVEKKEQGKVDLIILEMPDPSEDEKGFMNAVDISAREIARRMKPYVNTMLRRREQRAV